MDEPQYVKDLAAEFLTARLNEAEERERGRRNLRMDLGHLEFSHGPDGYTTYPGGQFMTEAEFTARYTEPAEPNALVLADIAAKRRILDGYLTTCRIRDEAATRIKAAGDYPDARDLKTWGRAQLEAVVLEGPVQHLASIYASHPHYKEDFRP